MIKETTDQTVVVVSAMGSSPESPVKVTDLILNMISKAARQDAAFLVDLAALQVRRVMFVGEGKHREGRGRMEGKGGGLVEAVLVGGGGGGALAGGCGGSKA